MSVHRVYLAGEPLSLGERRIVGDEAQHAVRVKRVEPGESIELLNGEGVIARSRVIDSGKERGEWTLRVEVVEVRTAEESRPRVEIWSAVPKGPRVADLVDGVSQAGAASWGPLRTARGGGESRDSRLERLARTAIEASKQSGRAWSLRIAPELTLDQAITADGKSRIVLADGSGETYTRSGADSVRLLVGPEGGWTQEEIEAARRAGCTIARFGPHVMRIETACVAACACVMQVESKS